MENESWRTIPGLEHYQASDQGNIRHTERKIPLTLQEHWKGYKYFYYWPTTGEQPRKRKKFYVHRAVALAFLGPPPTLFHTVDHIHGNRSDNRAAYLQWKTHSEQRINQGHSRRASWSSDPNVPADLETRCAGEWITETGTGIDAEQAVGDFDSLEEI